MNKRTLVFASHNRHKVEEMQAIFATHPALNEKFVLRSSADLDATRNKDIAETGSSLEENAYIKAFETHRLCLSDCFSDDTGLEVDALQGAPGIYSGRFANLSYPVRPETLREEIRKAEPPFEKNIAKLLDLLKEVPQEKRTARFRCVICLFTDGKPYYFEGKIEGRIDISEHGKKGFGYDGLFIPEGFSKSFAELEPEEKNEISHRGKAAENLIRFLETL